MATPKFQLSVRSDSASGNSGSSGGRDFLSSVSSELNGLAAQTTNMFSGLFGNKGRSLQQKIQQPFRLPQQASKTSKDSRQQPFGPFPRSKPSPGSNLDSHVITIFHPS